MNEFISFRRVAAQPIARLFFINKRSMAFISKHNLPTLANAKKAKLSRIFGNLVFYEPL